MSKNRPSGRMIAEFAQLVAAALVGAAVLVAIGYVPTQRLAGEDGLTSMAVGIGICVVASIIGALPVVYCREPTPASRQIAFLGAIAARMFATLILFGAAALSREFVAKPLAIWTGIGYLCLLGIETFVAIRLINRREKPTR